MRNEEECVCSVCVYSRCNILISDKIIKEMPVSVTSGTHCIITLSRIVFQIIFSELLIFLPSSAYQFTVLLLSRSDGVSVAL